MDRLRITDDASEGQVVISCDTAGIAIDYDELRDVIDALTRVVQTHDMPRLAERHKVRTGGVYGRLSR